VITALCVERKIDPYGPDQTARPRTRSDNNAIKCPAAAFSIDDFGTGAPTNSAHRHLSESSTLLPDKRRESPHHFNR
jgi:hypothetical protein